MNDYNKDYFWTSKDNVTGETKYYFKLNNTMVEVDKDVYMTCFNSYRKELNLNKKNEIYGVVSYDVPDADGTTLLDQQSQDYDYNLQIVNADLIKSILKVIDSLKADEKYLITSLLMGDEKEHTLANKYGVSQQAIHRRKIKIIKKIRKKIK